MSGLSPAEFTDLLPLVRRTFATFTPAERRMVAGRLTATPDRSDAGPEEYDRDRAARALATVDLILATTEEDR